MSIDICEAVERRPTSRGQKVPRDEQWPVGLRRREARRRAQKTVKSELESGPRDSVWGSGAGVGCGFYL